MFRKSLVIISFIIAISSTSFAAVPWWNNNYKYRQQITLTANTSVSSGYAVKVTIDTSQLESAGKIQSTSGNPADRKDWRIVYWSGSSNTELDRYYSGTSETWFKLQAGIVAGGSDSNYYVYYSNPNETTLAPNNLDSIFEKRTGTFTRSDATSGAATYIDSSTGKITEVNANVARFETGKLGKALIVEGSREGGGIRTNSLIQSSFESDSAGASPTGWTVTGTATVQTDYSKHGTKSVKISATAGRSYITQSQASLSSSIYSASVWVYIASYGGSGTVELALQDVTNTATTYATADTSKIGQWQRISTKNATASTSITVWLDVGRSPSATAVVYYDAVQLEKWGGSTDPTTTSYIPTTASAVNRNGEYFSYDVSGTTIMRKEKGSFSYWVNPSWGGAPSDWVILFSGGGGFDLLLTSSGNRMSLFYPAISDTYSNLLTTWTKGIFSNIVITWDEPSGKLVRFYQDGVDRTDDGVSGFTWVAISTLTLGMTADGPLNGTISDIGIYDSPLTASEVSALYTAQNNGTRKLIVPTETLATSGANLIFVGPLNGSTDGYTRTIVSPEPTVSTKGEQYYGYNTIITPLTEIEIKALDDPLVKLKIPANAVDKNITVNLNKITSSETGKAGIKQVLGVYDILATEVETNKSVTVFKKALTVTLHIKVSELPKGVSKSNLSIGFWSGTMWVPIESKVEQTGEDIIVSADTLHLTQFGIVIREGSKSLTVYPNPFTPASNQFNEVIFSFENGDNEEVELKIWDITGVLVRTIRQSGGTIIKWDGRNEYGEIVEGGVYIYQLTIQGSPPTRYRGTIVVAK